MIKSFSIPPRCRHMEKLPEQSSQGFLVYDTTGWTQVTTQVQNARLPGKWGWALDKAEKYKSQWCVPNKCMVVSLLSSETCSSTQRTFQQNLFTTCLVTQILHIHWVRPTQNNRIWNSSLQQTQPKNEVHIAIPWVLLISYNLSIYLVSDSQPALNLSVCLSLNLDFISSWSQNIEY